MTFLKGTFYKCLESSLQEEQLSLVAHPIPFGEMKEAELSWFDMDSALCGASKWDFERVPTSRELCDCLLGEWIQVIPQNFDNVLRGFLLLFEISTTEGWVDVMLAAVDQRGIDMQPVRDNNRYWALFFVVFLVLGAFFIMELFVGVIIENFARIRDVKGHGLMTQAQREWAMTQSFIMKIKPERRLHRPEGWLQYFCYEVVMNPWFDRFIVAVIIANSIGIASVSFGDSDFKSTVLELVNEICSAIFIIEAMLKLTALGTRYFRSRWNRFDFIVVCGLAAGFILKATISNQHLASAVSSLMSLIRIGRLLRLIRLVKPLRAIFNSIVTAIPGIVNIGALLVLLFFVYAVVGVQLYGLVAFQGELNEQANFRTLGSAMLLLLRFSTGENWNGFMWSLFEERADCDLDPVYNETAPWCLNEEDYPDCTEVNGCSAGYSVFAYFYSFTLIVSFVVLNMFVGVVLEAFEKSQEGDILTPDDLDHFVAVWAEFDPEATWFINASDVQSFLARLPPPLGIDEHERPKKGDDLSNDQCLMEISVNDKKQVNIVNVATLLAKRLTKQRQGDQFGELSDDHPIQRRILKQKEGMKMTLGDVYTHSSLTIIMAVRRFRRRQAGAIHPGPGYEEGAEAA